MSSSVQLNTCIDPALKQSGDAVFSRFGISPSEAVCALWRHVAQMQTLPDFISQQSGGQTSADLDSSALAQQSCGLALKLAQEQSSVDFSALDSNAPVCWEEEKGAMYDELLDKQEQT